MTIELLQKKLKELGVPDCCYNLTGNGNNDDRLNLIQTDGKWVVYYSERGAKTIYIETDSFDEAAEYIYNKYTDMARLVDEGKMRW